MKISNQMGLRGKLTKLDKEILCNSRMFYNINTNRYGKTFWRQCTKKRLSLTIHEIVNLDTFQFLGQPPY